jgi:hypothetical protein
VRTASPLLPHNTGDSIHEQVGAFMTLLVPRAPPKTDHIKSSRLRPTAYTNPALQNKSMYEQQKELSQALKQYENRPQPPTMPRADCEERNTSSSEYAKELIMKAQSLSMTISKQSKLSKQKLAIRRARNDFNGMILGDKQHQERIQQLTKELNKQRKDSNASIKRRQDEAIQAIQRKRKDMEEKKKQKSKKANPTREETEKLRMANERRYLQLKMEQLQLVKEKTEPSSTTLSKYDEDNFAEYERQKKEKAEEAHRQMRLRQANHLKKLEDEQRKKSKQERKEKKAKEIWLKNIKKEVMLDVKETLEEEQRKKQFRTIYGDTNDNLLWFDVNPKTTPRAPPSRDNGTGDGSVQVRSLNLEIVDFDEKRELYRGGAWNSRIASVLVQEAEEGDPYFGLQRLIFKEQNWRHGLKRYTSSGIAARNERQKRASSKKSNAWWTRQKLSESETASEKIDFSASRNKVQGMYRKSS